MRNENEKTEMTAVHTNAQPITHYSLLITHYKEKHGFKALHPEAVLFDMDGVLYDSMPRHAVAWQQSMAHYGLTMTADDAYATEGARGIDTIVAMVKRQQQRDISLDEAQQMYNLKSKIFHDMGEPPLMPGILSLLEQIKTRGLTIGVCTGSGQVPLINRLLKDFGDFLDKSHIVTAYDVTRGKPAPDPYLMGLQKAGNLHPWEAIVVENAPLGVQAGTAARIFTIAVNTGPLPDEMLAKSGADIIFSSMPELSKEWGRLYEEMVIR
jgi:HAD superfamily hydrolase (TIGR01509 family)